MNFFSNKIMNPTGKTQSWDEYLAKVLKTAGEAKPECDDDPRGQCRGQVINNDNEEGAHSYQEGESVDGKKEQKEDGSHKPNKTESKKSSVKSDTKQAHCDKEMGESNKAGDVTEEHSDAANADVDGARVEQNINNDPNYQKGESTNLGKGKKKEEGKKSKKEASKKGFQKIASMNLQTRMQLFAHMASQKNKNGKMAYPFEYIEAMAGVTFANLKDEEKTWFKKFWKTQYPDSYVDEMVKDR